MEHRAIISKGWVVRSIRKQPPVQSPDLSLGDRIWHKSDFGASDSESDLQIPHCSRGRFLLDHCPPGDYLSLNIGWFLPRERKESNSTTEPHINHLLETEPGWNNAWFSDCKSNYENPVNPTQVRPATGGGESKSEAVGFRSVRVFLWRFNSLPLSSVLSAVWTKCQFIFKLC